MRKRQTNLINNIQLIFFMSMLLLSGLFLIIQISSHNNKFKKQSEFIQENYIAEQKSIVKREVERVVSLIDQNFSTIEKQIEDIVRTKVYNSYSIAENIYNENKNIKDDVEIQKLIKDALRPIRFESGLGYMFINDYNGNAILNSFRPEYENLYIADLQDGSGQYVIRDMIDVSKNSGEGLYSYLWAKPGGEHNDYKKISFVKHFEPYDWIIGSGLNVDDIEQRVQKELLVEISNIRFGQEGYIFVNTLDAFALVSNGKLMAGDQKLWEVFDKNPDKTKELFDKEYKAAIIPEGDFIYYSIRKLSDSEVESPKTSYIYGIPQLNWLLGAGVYLDDVDVEIAKLQEITQKELRSEIQDTILFTGILILLFLFIFFLIGKRLQKDFHLFTEFFDKAVLHDVEIDLDKVKFQELIAMAGRANKMQVDKIEAQQNLLAEKEKLRISESKFRLLAENSKDMIFRMSFPDGNYDYISPASIDILGFTPQEIMDEPFHVRNTIHPDWREWLEEKISLIAKGKVEDTFEYQIINKSGEEIWVTQKNTLIKDDQGKVVALVGRLSDETERKKIEEQLNQSYRLEAIGQLAGGVAHDFNNVLAGIINASQVLKSPKRKIDDKGKMMVDLIMKAAMRAADLTAKLSTFSRKRTLMLKQRLY